MGEAEKVERRWLAVWMRATLALGAEVDEARLVRMEREPVPIKPLSQHFQNPFGVVVALERHHEVISKPHQCTWSRHAGLHTVRHSLVEEGAELIVGNGIEESRHTLPISTTFSDRRR